MNQEIRYLTFHEVYDIFQDVYATSWPGPKPSEEDEIFAQRIQEASMRINGLKVPTLQDE